MKLERRIRREGCAIRALEYAFDVSATDEECEIRLRHLDVLNQVIDRLESQVTSEEDYLKLSQFLIVQDMRLWQSMLDSFREHRTPLGRALRTHNQQHMVLSESRVLHMVTNRSLKVIGHMTLIEGGHIAFLGVAGGRLIRISDHNEPVPVKRRNTGFAVDVFRRK